MAPSAARQAPRKSDCSARARACTIRRNAGGVKIPKGSVASGSGSGTADCLPRKALARVCAFSQASLNRAASGRASGSAVRGAGGASSASPGSPDAVSADGACPPTGLSHRICAARSR